MKRMLLPQYILPASLSIAGGFVLAAYANVYVIVGGVVCVGFVAMLLKGVWRMRLVGSLFIVLLSMLYFQWVNFCHQSTLSESAESQAEAFVEGTIDSSVKQDGDLVTFYLLVSQVNHRPLGEWPRNQERIAMRVKLTKEQQIVNAHDWRIGDHFTGLTKLSVPESSRNLGGFDYARFLRWQGVFVTGSSSYPLVRVEHQGMTLRGVFDQIQQKEAETLEQVYVDPSVAGYMKSLLLGVTEDVDPKLGDMYSRQGLLHVLAISGLHVSLVSACWMWILRRLGLGRTSSMICAVGFLFVYVLLVGASPSAIRSGIMGGLGLIAFTLNRRISTLSIWGIAFAVMLILNPFQLWQAGFQLSFAVTLGLLVYVPMLDQLRGNIKKWLFSSLSVTLVAQMASFPLLIYWFHQFSLLSWVINLVFVPIISFVILPLGYVSLLVVHLHPALGFLLSKWNTELLGVLHNLLEWLDTWRIAFQHWPHPALYWMIAYISFCALVPLAWYRGYHRRRDLAIYIICWLLLVIAARQPFSNHDQVRITFLDVGQGDSIVVEVGREKVYLIDSGGTVQPTQEAWRRRRDPYEVGKDVILPFLRSRGIERIDTLVMTHPDNDHVGGMLSVIPFVHIGSVLVNGDTPKEAEWKALTLLKQRNIPIYTNHQVTSWQDQPQVLWTWLSPVDRQNDSKLEGNDASIVLMLTAYGRRVILTGDLEEVGEKRIVEAERLPQVDLLKVGHHGSKSSTSEAWLKALHPRAAVISVGKLNRYRHPHPEVIQRLEAAGVEVFRTDRQGAITALVTKYGITINPFFTDKQ
ncbi:DNA internalization-related competence protein ComEC/Rec2 [Brevibacillus ginsengisoli]|uniref:DNA internalization-related competence protein ComEC/Rec2 n=1 Tax=Brevibacillus ginsengisoli TaxID=363854 RepID=UPI003CF98794